ncbi:hypothetical protein PPACK8108_LOCUS10360 [Phakopsora pachyrhizi]|uniref:U6 snRNA phosphodiesterase 1 n=1 Tax=Phakopsora pachyrhizi TaxID=170000 RepID=A0AAV0AY72_PHAPC|nr:hypothetical protein PPACK8108_LOCUS10360 [Phakopsora pachyrhizi]
MESQDNNGVVTDVGAGLDSQQIRKRRRLPSPKFNFYKPKPIDNPEEHQGRERKKPHVDGDWPSHIYIPINLNTELKNKDLNRMIVECFIKREIVWTPLIDHGSSETKVEDSLHLSLSRHLSLKTDERKKFINSLMKSVYQIKPFEINFSNISILLNDHNSRAFLVLEVGNGHSKLQELTERIDCVLEEFCLEKYYHRPRFHISIASSVLKDIYKEQKILQNDKFHEKNIILNKISMNDDSSNSLSKIYDSELHNLNNNSDFMNCIRKINFRISYFQVSIGKVSHTLNFI